MPTSTSFSARSIDTNVSHSTANPVSTQIHHPVFSPSINSTKQSSYVEPISNGRTFPMPVLRTQPTPSSRSSTVTTQERAGFKPIEQQQSSIISDNTPRPTPIHPQTSHYPATERLNFVNFPEIILKEFILFFFFYIDSSNINIIRYTNTTIGSYDIPTHQSNEF